MSAAIGRLVPRNCATSAYSVIFEKMLVNRNFLGFCVGFSLNPDFLSDLRGVISCVANIGN